ncbi:hypothetical protein BaRGS_00002392 [Batillaria attramentaria]|uniref:Uncharacterized protein n=1 Tax=Batillaria attramentaria TaxID=370345 RepID=A0ABD0M464_9CAEN
MGKKSKDELRDEVSQVTLELRQLQGKVEDFQKIFRELEDKRQGVRRTHFPPKYFHMKDLAREYSHVATELRTTDEQTNGKSAEQRRQGPIARLMAASEAFAGKANTVHDLEAIRHVLISLLRQHISVSVYPSLLQELSSLKKPQLEEELSKRSSELENMRQLVKHIRQLLQDLERLYPDSKGAWPWARYKQLYHGVKYTVRSFNEKVTA